MAAWSKPRNSPGTMQTRLATRSRMKPTSRRRRIVMIGLATAPIRTQARWRAATSHQFGSWKLTTSPRATLSSTSAPANRSASRASWP